jgi:hypothetical protein
MENDWKQLRNVSGLACTFGSPEIRAENVQLAEPTPPLSDNGPIKEIFPNVKTKRLRKDGGSGSGGHTDRADFSGSLIQLCL